MSIESAAGIGRNGVDTGNWAPEADKPACQNTGDPGNVRYHQPGGRDGGVDADAGLVVRSGGHAFPGSLKAGGFRFVQMRFERGTPRLS
jgi:hypothetical protein